MFGRSKQIVIGVAVLGIIGLFTGQQPPEGCVEETPTPSPTPTPRPPVEVTFVADLNIDADSDIRTDLNHVGLREKVFVVGNFTDWNPNNPDFAMTETEEGSKVYYITLTFAPDTALEYKFAKTTSDPSDPWAEGQKDYKSMREQPCDIAPEGAKGALWEIPNYQYMVEPNTDLPVHMIDAWRATAESYGLVSCD